MEILLINLAIQIVMHFIKNPATDAKIIAVLRQLYQLLEQIPGVAS